MANGTIGVNVATERGDIPKDVATTKVVINHKEYDLQLDDAKIDALKARFEIASQMRFYKNDPVKHGKLKAELDAMGPVAISYEDVKDNEAFLDDKGRVNVAGLRSTQGKANPTKYLMIGYDESFEDGKALVITDVAPFVSAQSVLGKGEIYQKISGGAKQTYRTGQINADIGGATLSADAIKSLMQTGRPISVTCLDRQNGKKVTKQVKFNVKDGRPSFSSWLAKSGNQKSRSKDASLVEIKIAGDDAVRKLYPAVGGKDYTSKRPAKTNPTIENAAELFDGKAIGEKVEIDGKPYMLNVVVPDDRSKVKTPFIRIENYMEAIEVDGKKFASRHPVTAFKSEDAIQFSKKDIEKLVSGKDVKKDGKTFKFGPYINQRGFQEFNAKHAGEGLKASAATCIYEVSDDRNKVNLYGDKDYESYLTVKEYETPSTLLKFEAVKADPIAALAKEDDFERDDDSINGVETKAASEPSKELGD